VVASPTPRPTSTTIVDLVDDLCADLQLQPRRVATTGANEPFSQGGNCLPSRRPISHAAQVICSDGALPRPHLLLVPPCMRAAPHHALIQVTAALPCADCATKKTVQPANRAAGGRWGAVAVNGRYLCVDGSDCGSSWGKNK
jgi:hypothetical protein